jgi:copper chaperone NosL
MKIIRNTMFCLLLTLTLPAFANSAVTPGPRDKCLVCGMFVAKYPDWAAMIEYTNGRVVWFDGVKDLLKGLLAPGKYGLPKAQSDIKAIWVKDYYSLTFVDGRSASYVIGSDIMGPMGKELIPFAKPADAKGFLKDHLGDKVLRFDQLNSDILKKLE